MVDTYNYDDKTVERIYYDENSNEKEPIYLTFEEAGIDYEDTDVEKDNIDSGNDDDPYESHFDVEEDPYDNDNYDDIENENSDIDDGNQDDIDNDFDNVDDDDYDNTDNDNDSID